jgi:predicted Ser/Thr protein kinase
MPTIGSRIGPYVLVGTLGDGGMGRVFLAEDERLARKVALKVIAVRGPDAAARFLAEARVTAKCIHPNIVVIHDISTHGALPFMVLEYVEGRSLAELKPGELSPERAIEIMLQVARALEHAHSLGVIHRDLKPGNILIGPNGTVKVVDFGIARLLDDAEPNERAYGTLHYMAPELLRRGPADARVDLFAFGATLFYLLHGQPPFGGLRPDEVLGRLLAVDEPMPSLADVQGDLPPALIKLVDQCLEKRPERRIGSASDIRRALEAMVPHVAGEPAAVTTTVRQRKNVAAAILTAVVLVAVLLAVAAGRITRGARPATDAAALKRVEELGQALDRLHAKGATVENERLFQDFVQHERDPNVVAQAWLMRGERQRGRGESAAARASFANAYARATVPSVQHEALMRLATEYLHAWEWDRVARAIAVDRRLGFAGGTQATTLHDRALLAMRSQEARTSQHPATAAVATALLRGTPSAGLARSAVVADVDRDQRDEVISLEGQELVVRSRDTLAERSRYAVPDANVVRCAGADQSGAYALTSGATFRLTRLDREAPSTVLNLYNAYAPAVCLWRDVDGDGAIELYVIGSRQLFRVARDARGRWQSQSHELGSEPWDVIADDLDGDGKMELVISVGEWKAYDVRLVRIDAAGAMRMVDRMRLGVVTNLATLRHTANGRPLVAALKRDIYPSAISLPRDHPFGAPAGIYLLSVTGDKLELVRRIDIELRAGEPAGSQGLLGVDIDGNGRTDIVASMCSAGRAEKQICDLSVLLAKSDGSFDSAVLGGMGAFAAIESDGDKADELVVQVDKNTSTWIVGAGDKQLPAVKLTPITPQRAPASVTRERAVAAAWARAEDLAQIGQVEAAVDALRRIAAFGASMEAQADALRRAAALLRTTGRSAAEPLEDLARLQPIGSGVRIDARLDALDEYVAAGEVLRARQRATELRVEMGHSMTKEQRNRLAALDVELAGAGTVLFGGALHPAWHVLDPTLMHVPPGSRELALETLTPDTVATVPLQRGGGALTLSITGQITRTDWAGDLTFRLEPRDATQASSVQFKVGAVGGGDIHHRRFACETRQGTTFWWDGWEQKNRLRTADEPVAVRVDVELLPSRRLGRCTVTIAGQSESTTFAIDVTPDPGWQLSILGGWTSELTSATARISSIEVTGFATDDEPASDPISRASFALAEHRAADALTILGELARTESTSWRARRATVLALDETGQRPRAIAVLGSAHASTQELAILMRAREGQLAPLVRTTLGRGVAPVLQAAWHITAYTDRAQVRVVTKILDELDRLPPADATTSAATLVLGYVRGEALFSVGRTEEARRVLLAAFELHRSARVGGRLPEEASRIAVRLASDAAGRGDLDGAEQWAARAFEVTAVPTEIADALLLDPSARLLLDRPIGAKIRELGRDLLITK